MFSPRKFLTAVAGVSLLAIGGAAQALTLSVNDAYYVGLIDDGIPSNPTDEVAYINGLIALAPGATGACDTETCTRSMLAGPFDAATIVGAGKDDTGDINPVTLATPFQYILGKYGNSGSYVWYSAAGFSGEITVPGGFGVGNGGGLSHISWYNPVSGDDDDDDDDDQLPEPGTLALFGLGLMGLGLSRRRRA